VLRVSIRWIYSADASAFDSGQTALLLLFHGTLPITYRGATYQIPLHIWIPHEYPRSPPLAFVVPTKEMAVRKGREVEPGGRIRGEIVEEWWQTWQVCSAVCLTQCQPRFAADVATEQDNRSTTPPARFCILTNTPRLLSSPRAQCRSDHSYLPPSRWRG
jgi:hypothetical protein